MAVAYAPSPRPVSWETGAQEGSGIGVVYWTAIADERWQDIAAFGPRKPILWLVVDHQDFVKAWLLEDATFGPMGPIEGKSILGIGVNCYRSIDDMVPAFSPGWADDKAARFMEGDAMTLRRER